MKKRYFKNGQKIFLRALSAGESRPDQLNSLTAYLQGSGADFFDLHLPYDLREGEEYPFPLNTPFELLSDTMGLGLRLTGRFQGWRSRDLIRIATEDDLRVFQHRLHPRLDTQAGLRFSRGRGMLRTFHQQWEKTARSLQEGEIPKTSDLPRTRVNLSAGGIRFKLKAPVKVADLCLLLLELEPGQRPMCVLAEVMWAGEIEEGRQSAGMRFLSMLQPDQKRIEEFIRKNWAQAREN